MGKKSEITLVWEIELTELLKRHHKRNIDKLVTKLIKRLKTVHAGMRTRSMKYNVECSVTVNDLYELTKEKYGSACKYTGRILKLDNMVFDHIVPISKGGASSKANTQLISRFANNMKGSLMEEHLQLLLDWLETVPEELKKDISIRLAHGIR